MRAGGQDRGCGRPCAQPATPGAELGRRDPTERPPLWHRHPRRVPIRKQRSDMGTGDRVSTGSSGFDQVIDGLRLGDNVVWQVDSVLDYKQMVDPYVAQSRADGRRLVYVRFGNHGPLVEDGPGTTVCQVDPTQGVEIFATEVHNLAERHGKGAFYVFDCLTDLLPV